MKIATILVIPVVAALAACAPTEVTDSPDGPGAKTSSARKPAAAPAKLGDTITLKSNDDGLKIAVTVVKVAATARGKTEFDQPEPGQRFAAVQVVLKNVGSIAYDDSPGNGAHLIDAHDQQYDTALNDVALGASIDSSVKLGPGSSRRGYLVFSVPKKARLAKFQFSLDSGFGPQAGEWLLS